MRIFQLITSFSVYGAEQVAYRLARCAASNGVDSYVVAVRRDHNAKQEQILITSLEADGIKTVILGTKSSSVWNLLSAARLLHVLSGRTRLDILHTHTDIPDFVAAFSFTTAKVIRTVHNTVIWPRRPYVAWIVEQLLSPRFEIAVSTDAAKAWVRYRTEIGLTGETMPAVISNLPTVNRGEMLSPEASKSKFKLSVDKYHVAAIGRLVSQKGTDILIESALSRWWPINTVLHVFGDGDLLSTVLDAESRVDHVVYHGVVSDVAQYLRGFDALVMPSRFEGIGLVLLEALEAEVPAIVSRCEGISGWLGPEYPHYIQPLTAEALGRSLQSLPKTPVRPHGQAQGSGSFCSSYMDFYRQLIQKQV